MRSSISRRKRNNVDASLYYSGYRYNVRGGSNLCGVILFRWETSGLLGCAHYSGFAILKNLERPSSFNWKIIRVQNTNHEFRTSYYSRFGRYRWVMGRFI